MPSFGGFYTITAGVDTPIEVGQGGLSGVLLGNESGLSVIVKMGGNYSRSLYPGWVDYFPIPQSQFSGIITVSPQAMLNNISSWPSSFIQVDILGVGEQVHGTYPAPLVRSSNVGNAVNTVGGTASAIQNDANEAGTSIVEATVTGDGSSAVSWTNNAILVNGDAAHPGTVSLDNGAITTDGSGDMAIGGTLKVVKATALGGALNTVLALLVRPLSAGAPGVVIAGLASQSGNLFEAQNSSFTNVFIIDPSGNTYIPNATLAVGNSSTNGETFLAWSNSDTVIPIVGKANSATQSADLLELQSSTGTVLFKVDKSGNFTGANLTSNGASTLDGGSITTNGSGDVTLAGTINGALYIDTGATPGSSNIRLGTSAANAGNLLDNPAGTNQALYIKNPSGGTGSFVYQSPNGTTRWSLGAMNTGTANSGTINHGLGGTPAAVLCVCDNTSSSATVGAYSYTTTQFGMTIGGSLNGRWWAYR